MIRIDGLHLSLDQIQAVATGNEEVAFSDSALTRMKQSYAAASAVAQRRPVYGRTTGVGANRSVPLDVTDSEHGLNLLRSHAVDAGPVVEATVVRAMLLIRASQLAAGGSGIHPSIPVALIDLLNDDVIPEIRRFGGIGTGDLPALAGTALTLLGERTPVRGTVTCPLEGWELNDALPFISSNALTLAYAALAVHGLDLLLSNLLVTGALSSVALRGNQEAWSQPVASALGNVHAARAARALTELTKGKGTSARIQDPYCLRTLPQSLGAQQAELVALKHMVEQLAASPLENPLVHWSDVPEEPDVAHHGLFQMTDLAQRADALGLALGSASSLTLRRISLLNDPQYTGLERFLASTPSGASGVMMLEYVAAAAAGWIRANAQPASLQTVVLSLGAEEDASFASISVEQLMATTSALATLLAAEFVSALRALRLQGVTSEQLEHRKMRSLLRQQLALPHEVSDRDMRGDLQAAEQLITTTTLISGVLSDD